MNDPDNVCKRKMSNKLHNKSQKHTETAMGLYWSDKVLKNDLLKGVQISNAADAG